MVEAKEVNYYDIQTAQALVAPQTSREKDSPQSELPPHRNGILRRQTPPRFGRLCPPDIRGMDGRANEWRPAHQGTSQETRPESEARNPCGTVEDRDRLYMGITSARSDADTCGE